MKLILSTGNIVSGGPSIIRKPGGFRSNLELTNSLRSAFLAAKQDYAPFDSRSERPIEDPGSTGGGSSLLLRDDSSASSSASSSTAALTGTTPLDAWTERVPDPADPGGGAADADVLYIPRVDWSAQACSLQEPVDTYELTLKLFFLNLAPVADRAAHAREALGLVRRRLGLGPAAPVDLLILSFPGVSFEGECEVEADRRNAEQGNLEEEAATWRALEPLHGSGEVRALGLAEFGGAKLGRFLARVAVKPKVDQINIRDCCKVPAGLVKLGAEAGVTLLVHSDCTDILPRGTLRELLGHGFRGAGVLADPAAAAQAAVTGVPAATGPDLDGRDSASGLEGDITPLWVVKYTAFVKDRGVVENKGYFAAAELGE